MLTFGKHVLKNLTPPFIWSALRKLRKKGIVWRGDYSTWQQAESRSFGYSQDLILERVANATRKVIQGEYAFERDSVLFKEHHYNWPLLATILHIASKSGGVNVIDFGGSLGSSYWQNREFFNGLNVKWVVVEQPHFARLGKSEFANDCIDFKDDLSAALCLGANAVLFSSVLQYLSAPLAILQEVVKSGVEHIIVDLTPVSDRDRVAVQIVPSEIYPASYPCRVFRQSTLLDAFHNDYDIVAQWESENQPSPRDFRYKGFYFKKRM